MDKRKNFFSLKGHSRFDNVLPLLLILFVPKLQPLAVGALFIHIYARTAGEKYLLTALLALYGAFIAYGKVKLALSMGDGQDETTLTFAYGAFVAALWNSIIFVLVPMAIALRERPND